MTYNDDFARLNFANGTQMNVAVKELGLEWPPPEKIMFLGEIPMERERYSQITDEQREGLTHVVRGAEYREVSSAGAD